MASDLDIIRALVELIAPGEKTFLGRNNAPEHYFRLRVDFVWG